MNDERLPRPMVWYGLAGLLPQLLCLALVLGASPWRWVALAAACFYAALILSFLGGMWWMAAALGRIASPSFYGISVLPSLLGLAALLPWCFGWTWPGPSLVVLGVLLLASPAVDRELSKHVAFPTAWLRLRLILSLGLGAATLILAAG